MHLAQAVALVRRRLAFRDAGDALGVGALTVGGLLVAGGALAWLVPGHPASSSTLLASGAGLVGLLTLWARIRSRRRRDDVRVVQWIDRRLDAQEALVTVHALGPELGSTPGTPTSAPDPIPGARRRAQEALTDPAARRRLHPGWASPGLVRGGPAGLGLALVGSALWAGAPSPPPPAPAAPAPRTTIALTGDEIDRLLAPIRSLRDQPPPPAGNKSRAAAIETVAAEAESLAGDLEAGRLTPREALAAIDHLRDRLGTLHDQETEVGGPEGRDAAARALAAAGEPGLAAAVRGAPDRRREALAALDDAVARAAARREAADRRRARDALDEAHRAAAEAGDDALAGRLLRAREALDDRAAEVALARELQEALPELARETPGGRALERLAREGDPGGPGLTPEMVAAVREAWSRLDAEERAALAEAVRRAERRAAGRHDRPDPPSGEGEGEPAPAPSADELERALRAALEATEALQGAVAEAGAAAGQDADGRLAAAGPGEGRPGGGAGLPLPGQGTPGQPAGGAAGAGGGAGEAGGDPTASGERPGAGGDGGGGVGGGGPGGGGGGTWSPGGRAGGGGPEGAAGEPGVLARVRPTPRHGALLPEAEGWRAPGPIDSATIGTSGDSPGTVPVAGDHAVGGIGRPALPRDYEDHVRAFFSGAGRPGAAGTSPPADPTP